MENPPQNIHHKSNEIFLKGFLYLTLHSVKQLGCIYLPSYFACNFAKNPYILPRTLLNVNQTTPEDTITKVQNHYKSDLKNALQHMHFVKRFTYSSFASIPSNIKTSLHNQYFLWINATEIINHGPCAIVGK